MKSNNLIYSTSKKFNNGKEHITVNIRLNDECKNGHQDFAITAEIKELRGSRFVWAAGGCCHDEILKVFPEFKIFVDLHLCDYLGNPMYADANGFYHLKNWEDKKQSFADYYGMTAEQFEIVKHAEDKEHYNYLIRKAGVVDNWRKKAKKAIKQLEKLTGKQFEIDSTRTQFTPNDKATDKLIEQRIKSGYYKPERIEQRAQQAAEAGKQKLIEDLKEDATKDINKIQTELNLKLYILECGLSIDNFIYYNHSNKGVFNWNDSSYRHKTSENDFNMFVSHLDRDRLPDGIVFELKGVREFTE